MNFKENLKYRDIKTYGSTEWLFNNAKKYRSVFDEREASNIYCEFSFFNKKYDEENCDLKLILKCFYELNELICELNCDRTVDKSDNIVFVREGWGVKTPGTYWKSGAYRWEAHIEDELIGSTAFYIENKGLVRNGINPYFTIGAVRLYEGPDANLVQVERKYSTRFNTSNTRYIWIEFNAINKVRKKTDWACELIFNYKTSSGQLKGTGSKLFFVRPDDTYFNITFGWGSDTLGTWGSDTYCIEVIFMDELVKRIPFIVCGDHEEACKSAAWRCWQKIKKLIWPNRFSRNIN